MSTFKVSVGDDDLDEFDFRRAAPSPFRDVALRGLRFHIVTDGAVLPTFHVTARPRGTSWWIEIDGVDGSGRFARWSTIEATAREMVAESLNDPPSEFDLVIDLPPVERNRGNT